MNGTSSEVSLITVVQRVLSASVVVDGKPVGEIANGLLALVAVHGSDDAQDIAYTANKLTTLRIFRNQDRHFDLDVRAVNGSILLVSNFTVAGETRYGRRPSLDAAASPAVGKQLFDQLVQSVRSSGIPTAIGQFGADMKISLVNDGPVTFLIDSRKASVADSPTPQPTNSTSPPSSTA